MFGYPKADITFPFLEEPNYCFSQTVWYFCPSFSEETETESDSSTESDNSSDHQINQQTRKLYIIIKNIIK